MGNDPLMPLPRDRRLPPNAPADAPWRQIIARTRAARVQMDAAQDPPKPRRRRRTRT